MVPSWFVQALVGAAVMIIGKWLWDQYQRKNPTAKEKQDLSNDRIDFVKNYNDAQFAHLQLTDTLQKMVDKKTDQLENILIKREIEHATQIEGFIRKLAEETTKSEDYWDQLKDAKRELAYWKELYEALKNKYEPEPPKLKKQ